jgi:hypothetical protein
MLHVTNPTPPGVSATLAPGNSRHLHEALKHRADDGKNVVLAVSNGGDGPPFVEMTKWWGCTHSRCDIGYTTMLAVINWFCDHTPY